MALAVSGTPVSTTGISVTSLTVAFDATGCDGIYFGTYFDSNTATVTSATYAGNSMTALGNQANALTTTRNYAFLGTNPTTGSNNAVANFSTTVGGSSGCALHVVGFSGMETSSVGAAHRTFVGAAETSSPSTPAITLSDAASGDICIGTCNVDQTTITEGNTFQLENQNIVGGGKSVGTETQSASGSTNLTYSTSSYWTFVGVPIVPASGASAKKRILPGLLVQRAISMRP